MPLQQPVHNPVFKIEHPVKKDEIITWTMQDDWFKQFVRHLDWYIATPRHKAKNHRKFAEQLKVMCDNIEKAPDKNTMIHQSLIPLLQAKTNLVEKGWKGKSYLYALCQFSHQQFYNHIAVQSCQRDLGERASLQIESLQAQVKRKDDEITNLQAELTQVSLDFSRKEEGLYNEQTTISNNLNSLRMEHTRLLDERTKLRKERDALRTDLDYANRREKDLLAENKNKVDQLVEQVQALQKKLLEKSVVTTQEQKASPSVANISEDTSSLASRINALEQENNTLKEELETAKQEYRRVALKNSEYQSKCTDAIVRAENAEREVSAMRKAYNLMVNFIDKLFGTSLDLKVSELLTENHREPTLNETQYRLFRTIAGARGPELKAAEKEVADTVAKIEKGEEYRSLEDKFRSSLQGGISGLRGSFLARLTPKKGAADPREDATATRPSTP